MMGHEIAWSLPGERLDVRVLFADVNEITPHNWSHRLTATHWRLYQHNAPGGFLNDGTGHSWELEAGRVYLIPSGRVLFCRCTTPFRQLYLHFDLLGFFGLSAEYERFPGPVAVPDICGSFGASVANLADGLAGEPRAERDVHCRDSARECWMRGVICEGLGRYLASLPTENTERFRARLAVIQAFYPALEYIHNHLSEHLTNAQIAARCSMSEDHFIRRFRAATGMPPARYILQRRVARAAELLLATGESIESIAQNTGFCDRYYFTRVFSRLTGVSPAFFRKGNGR